MKYSVIHFIKWSAPESLKYGKFSSKSDIWSFGVCVWELFSKGEMPYFTMTNAEAMEKVATGYRLQQPKGCPDEVYKLMLSCWNEDPMERPSFEEVLNILNDLFQKIAIQNVQEQSIVTVELSDNAEIYNN